MYENSLIVFVSDNGGNYRNGGASNYPLAQGKCCLLLQLGLAMEKFSNVWIWIVMGPSQDSASTRI